MMNCGFHLSHKRGKRRPVEMDAAFDAFCQCDARCQLNAESYLSAFSFGDEFAHYLVESGSTKNYGGECFSKFLWFDIDRAELIDALAATIKLCRQIINFGCLAEWLLIFFSGSKGFHIGLPTDLWQPNPSEDYHHHCRAMALELAGEVAIDTAVYVKVQPFRSPNSRHPKSGLYKRRLTFEQLSGLGIEKIKQLAEKPEGFDFVPPAQVNDKLLATWNAISTPPPSTQTKPDNAKKVGNKAGNHNTNAERLYCDQLNTLTMEFIRKGAGEGDRHRLLFSSAANLAEFDCSPELAYALLIESALDCGLNPQDAKRQIKCGLKKGGC